MGSSIHPVIEHLPIALRGSLSDATAVNELAESGPELEGLFSRRRLVQSH